MPNQADTLKNATQDTRHIAVSTNFDKDALLLIKVYGREELSRLFEYDLEMMSVEDDLDPSKIVGHNVTIRVDLNESESRYLNGYVSEFRHVGWADRVTTYRATVVPWLWFLTQTSDCRIFQEKSTVEIVEQIFGDLNFKEFRWALSGDYPKHEYCVQYRETDFNFVSRLLEEEGIFYFFEHVDGKHTLVLGDSPDAYYDLKDKEVEHPDPSHTAGNKDQIKTWERRYAFRTGAFAHTDYDFKQPTKDLMSKTETTVDFKDNKSYEVYDYHGRHVDTSRGQALAKVRIEEIEASHDVATGSSTYRSFSPGGKFTFKHHRSKGEEGNSYMVTAVETFASAASDYFSGDSDAIGEPEFENRFTCVPDSTAYRPPRKTQAPIVEGPQTAVIVGPSSESSAGIHVDEFGRVKVQFHWDREGKRDEKSSCWMRVSQAHAGKQWGYIDIPRVDEEVIVSFIEGDPDRPIITGRVYNGQNPVPFDLSDSNNQTNKTRRGNTTRSYKKDGGFNEMSMDDTPGKEQIRIHAQYNMDTVVENDETHTVNHDRTKTIKNDETTTVGNNRTETVEKGNETVTIMKGDRTVNVDTKNDTLNVKKGDQTVNVDTGNASLNVLSKDRIVSVAKGNYNLTAKKEVKLVAEDKLTAVGTNEVSISGKKISITATQEITIGVGSSTITIKADGITTGGAKLTSAAVGIHELSGALVKIN